MGGPVGKRIAVVNLKGGAGKTTTSVYLALLMAIRGAGNVALIDADPHRSAYEWSTQVPDFPVTVVCMPSPDIHVRVPAMAAGFPGGVVIDTPPQDDATVESALRAVDEAVIP